MNKNGRIYQIKITLDGIKPSIWRRILVQADMTFTDFHEVLQIAVGWEDCHLHEFRFQNVRVRPYDDESFGMVDTFGREQALNGDETRLDELFGTEKKCGYIYDFGDSWEHTVLLEKELEPEPGKSYPVCIKGARACPPEDCGGIWGYAELLEILANPSHPEYEDRRAWLFGSDKDDQDISGWKFAPEEFELAEINEELSLLSEYFEAEKASAPPTPEQWRRLYETAERIKAAKPWERLWDNEYIAIQPNGREEPVYYVTMGRLGECVAVAAFPGHNAIAGLEKIHELAKAGAPFAAIGRQDCAICYFGDRDELDKEDRQVLKELGFKFRGKGQWIFFRSLKPGYAPWRLNTAEADMLLDTMEQYLEVCEDIQGDDEAYFNEGAFILRKYAPPPSAKPWIDQWVRFDGLSPAYVRATLTNELYVARLKKQKKTKLEVELESIFLPSPVQEHRAERPYFPRFALLVDSTGGMILNQKAVSPEESVGDIILDMLEKLVMESGRPRSLHVRDEELGYIVEDWCKKLDVRLITDPSMPATDEAIDSLLEFLGFDEDMI